MGDDPKIVAGRKCLKCDEPAGYYSSNPKQAVYCKDCFFAMILHKFSYVLGKNRVFKDNNKKDVLILYRSKIIADEYLLQTVKEESTGPRPQLPAHPQILVILESIKDEELFAEYRGYKKKESEYSWPWIYVHFSEVFQDNINFYEEGTTINEEKKQLTKYLFNKSTAKSDRKELRRLLTERLIYRICKKLDVDKVMIGDTAEVTAQNAFNALCFGRGSSMSQLSAGLDTRYPGVSIIRPLREIYDADVKLIMKLKKPVENGLQDMDINQVEIKKKAIIQDYNLQELVRLQSSGFASTLTNVIQTAVKVKPPLNPEATNTCCLCWTKTENIDYCGSCERLFEAIPDFPQVLKDDFKKCIFC